MDMMTWVMDYIYKWRKYNYYVGTLMGKYLYHELWGSVWWNHIDRQLILGGIPLHNLGHLEALKQENVGAIICILEPFELTPTMYFNPVSREDWENHGVTVLQISAADTYGVKVDDIIKGVEFICQQRQIGKTVYVHCKAGKGRSASIVLGYLIHQYYQQFKHIEESDITRVYQALCLLRGEVHINRAQMAPILEYAKNLANGTSCDPKN